MRRFPPAWAGLGSPAAGNASQDGKGKLPPWVIHPRRPGQAKREPGPITTDLNFCGDWSTSHANHKHLGLWVPAFAGTTITSGGAHAFFSATRNSASVLDFTSSSVTPSASSTSAIDRKSVV